MTGDLHSAAHAVDEGHMYVLAVDQVGSLPITVLGGLARLFERAAAGNGCGRDPGGLVGRSAGRPGVRR